MPQIQLTNQPNQRFTVRVPSGNGNTAYNLLVSFNTVGEFWQLDIADANGNPLIKALALVSTYPQNLLESYAHLGLGSIYVLPVSTHTLDYPGVNDWGTNFVLLWE